jgi:hypothetical protein
MSKRAIKSLKYFELEIGGYFAEGSKLRFKDSKILSSRSSFMFGDLEEGNSTCKKVTPEKEKEFVNGLNAIDVINWSKEYIDEGMCDGTEWTIKLQYNGSLKKHIYGSNEFPKEFEELLGLCNSILEKPVFEIKFE